LRTQAAALGAKNFDSTNRTFRWRGIAAAGYHSEYTSAAVNP
jgi:hypothetical protein